MRLIQFEDRAGQRRVGVVEGAGIQVVRGVRSTRELGLAAIRAGSGLHDEVLRRGSEPGPDYAGLLEEEGCCRRWIMTTRPIAWSAAPA